MTWATRLRRGHRSTRMGSTRHPGTAASPLDVLHQAGAIPYSVIDGEVHVLLVTSRGSGRWLIPKGNIDPGLTPAEAAAKETYEEAGIRGKIATDTPLGFFTAFKTLKSGEERPVTVEVYALLVDRQLKRWPEAKEREACWMTASDAARSVKEPGLARLLLRLKEIIEPENAAGVDPPSDNDDSGAAARPSARRE
jgi:8-oxo-dGTP pyrophosphatase MutT (NUDIX family)